MLGLHTTVHLTSTPLKCTPEESARFGITFVYADNENNTILVCIGSSLQICDPPEAQPRLLAGNQRENGFRDGIGPEARLSTVHGIVVSKQTVFFTDWMNNCIREIAIDGTVHTLYGAKPQLSGVCGESGFSDGFGTSARFHRPWGICLYANDTELLVVDGFNSCIRRIDRKRGLVTTLALQSAKTQGTRPEMQCMFFPNTIQVGPDGLVYVGSPSSHQILCITMSNLTFTASDFYGDIPNTYRPVSMHITASGKMLVGYTGYQTPGRYMRDTKLVSWRGTQVWCGDKNTVYYRHNSKVEICSCLSLALSQNTRTGRSTLWITDCQKKSRLLCLRPRINWPFLRVLLVAIKKPVHQGLFGLLPTYTHNHQTYSPVFDIIIHLLENMYFLQ